MRLLWLALSLAGCRYYHPFEMEIATLPGTVLVGQAEEAIGRRCRPFLFGIIPLRKNYRYEDLVRDAGGTPDAPLFGLTVDEETIFWLVGYTRCHRLHAWRTAASAPAERGASPPTSSHGAAAALTPVIPEILDAARPEVFILSRILFTRGEDWPEDPEPTLAAIRLLIDAGVSLSDIYRETVAAGQDRDAPVIDLLPGQP